MQENHSESSKPRYVYRLPKETIAGHVCLGTIDLHLLRTYKTLRKEPITAVIHAMIAQAIKCWEEKHDIYIRELEKRNRILAEMVATYLEKYGKIRPKGLETPVKGAKEEEAEEKGKPADKDEPPEQ